jgi:tripartite-type tricarboxylate transporter receptor subunit TctC
MKMAFAIALVVLAASNVSSTAQVYPSRPITLIVPFSAGGPTDTIGRIFAERYAPRLVKPSLSRM